jgi:hypothetical protein
MTVLLALFATKWVRYGAGLALLLAALWGYGEYKSHQGKQEGVSVGHSDAARDAETARQQDRKELDAKISSLSQIASDAHSKAEKAEIAAGLKDEVIRSLVQQRQNAVNQVAGMTEAQVAALVAKYTPRDLAACVAERPALESQVKEQDAKIAELSNAIAETKRENLATVDMLNSQQAYTTQLERDYVSLYNWQSPKIRAAKCMYLWKCGRKLIPFPAPNALHKPQN